MILFTSFLIVLLLCGVPSTSGSPTYVAEVYFIVEPQVVRNYVNIGYDLDAAKETIRSDAKYVVSQANEYYKTSFHGNIEIRIKQLDIMDEELFIACKLIDKNVLNVDLALAVIREWLKKQDHARTGFDYDMALVWTGYDAMGQGGNHQVTGYAPVKGICNKAKHQNIAIVEFDGTQRSAETTAHEIGHNLGSDHDQTAECPPSQGYIMSPTSRPHASHRWSFSHCSVRSITNYLQTLDSKGNNCLRHTSTQPTTGYNLPTQRDILNPEKLCQRVRKDKDSYFCHYKSLFPNQDEACQLLWCAPKDSTRCSSGFPSEGMPCDVNKRCRKGKCEQAIIPTPDSVKSGCVFGDIKSRIINQEVGATCQSMLKEDSKMCYNKWFEEECCAECDKLNTHLSGCEYGDRSKQCQDYGQDDLDWLCNSANNRHICCQTCSKRSHFGKRFAINRTDPTIPKIKPDFQVFNKAIPAMQDSPDDEINARF